MVHPDRAHSGLAIRNILVIGDTDIAHSILHQLRHLDPPRELTLLTGPTQTPSSASASAPAPRHLTTDFSAQSLREALGGQDLVISTDHGGDYGLQTRIVNAAVAAGVTRFVPHEFGQDSRNEGVQGRLPPHAERARLIKYLRAMESEGAEVQRNGGEEHVEVEASSGYHNPFSWVALATGTILDKKLVNGNLGFDIKWQSATVHGTGKEEFAVSSLEWVGRSVARAVERWESVRNQYLYAAGCVTTADKVVECLQKITGKEWGVGRVDVDDCVKEAERCLKRGFPDAGIFLMERSVLYDTALGAVESFNTTKANDVLGIGEEKVEEIVGKALHEFEHHGKAECGCS
ncbi:hypothetical protein GTA08_BOTSDO03473 [Botryosphaeria dothidea]|uniref:NmrA-like domain-containing protein n=1 Tax=Botryosphaeria dothidea TaxID=55169 RepID=A0A8H4IVX7_9PEZI|nr:hypothetical protein GTA08_BOTSDO03473 [Botryosphaeria dothidea]